MLRIAAPRIWARAQSRACSHPTANKADHPKPSAYVGAVANTASLPKLLDRHQP
jgi:hypothetical protein